MFYDKKWAVGLFVMVMMVVFAGTDVWAAYETIDNMSDVLPIEAGEVTVSDTNGDTFENCGYFPISGKVNIKWKNFSTFSGLGEDALLQLPASEKNVCICNIFFKDANGKRYVAYDNGISIQKTSKEEVVFENINVSDLYERRYVAYFFYEALKPNQWNRYKKIEMNIDFKAPDIQEISAKAQKSGGAAATSVLLHTQAADEESGLSAQAYSIDGGMTWQTSPDFTVYRNGMYTVTVRDKTHQTSSKSVLVEGIDGEGPVIKEITKKGLESKNGYAKQVQIKVTAEDSASGLAKEAYSFDGGKTFLSQNSITVSHNGNIQIAVRDSVGNCTQADVTVTEIDGDGPVLHHAEIVPLNGIDGYGTKAEVSLEVEDNCSGLAAYPISFDGGQSFTSKKTRSYTSNGIYHVLLKDALGNVSEETFEVKCIDREAPVIEEKELLSSLSANGFSSEKTVRFHVADCGVGLAGQAFSYDRGITWTDQSEKSVTENGKVEVWVRDKLMNTTKDVIEITGIDSDGPVIGKIEKELLNRNGDYGTEMVVTVHAADAGAGLSKKPYSFDGGKNYTDQNTITVKENTTISLVVSDALSHETRREIRVEGIDRTAPFGDISGNPKETVKRNVVLTFTGRDAESGISAIWYQSDRIKVRHLLGTYDGEKTVKEKATITANGKYRFIVRDMIGNEAEYTVNVTKIKKDSADSGSGEDSGSGGNSGGSGSGGNDGGSDSGGSGSGDDGTVVIVDSHPADEDAPSSGSIVTYPSEELKVTDEKSSTAESSTKKARTTRVVKRSAEEEDEYETEKEAEPEKEDDLSGEMETVESLLKENLSEPEEPTVSSAVLYPDPAPEEDKAESKKIILATLGIIVFLSAVAFAILWYKGVIPFGKKEEEEC